MCNQKPFACAYTLRHMLVADLWLWGGCPAPGLSSELMGATPPPERLAIRRPCEMKLSKEQVRVAERATSVRQPAGQLGATEGPLCYRLI